MFNFRRRPARAERTHATFLAAIVLCGLGCSRNEAVLSGAMSGPAGLVVAGSQHDRLFVAMRGLDALQVVDAASALPQVHFVVGPARYFPLYIPVGPSPTEVAASSDGRYVFALDALNNEVRAVDADAASVLIEPGGGFARVAAGPREARPVAMLGHVWPGCVPSEADATEDCLGRSYVVLEALGAVAAVDVRRVRADNALRLRLDATYVIGGAPRTVAAHPTLPVLFVGDASSGQVVRLGVADDAAHGVRRGQFDRVAVPGDVGPLAVSGDGTVLAVGRPASGDVALFVAASGPDAATAAHNLATGTLQQQRRPSVVGPKPACLQACGEAQSADCSEAHPADASLCVAPEGYRTVAGRTYDGLWLGSAPQAMVALSPPQAGGSVRLVCREEPQRVQTVPHALVVATFDGAVRFIGFGPDAPFAAAGVPSLLDVGFCRAPEVTSIEPLASAQAAQVLGPCPDAPAGDARLVRLAIGDANANAPQVGLWRGQLRRQSFRLVWEDVLPGGNQPAGNGAIDASGRFYDVVGGVDRLAAVDVQAQKNSRLGAPAARGDILEVLTAPVDDPACGTLVDDSVPTCAVERRIVGVESGEDGRRRLVLDAPLPAKCFLGPIAYRLRAGDAFLVGPGDAGAFTGTPVRMGPGDIYGPGHSAGEPAAVFFRIAKNLDVGAELSACARYRDNAAAPDAPAWRSRRSPLGFVVTDPYLPLQAARSAALDPAADTAPGGSVGQLPYAAVLMPKTDGRGALLWVSYFASSGLLAAHPLDSSKLGVGDAGRLLQ